MNNGKLVFALVAIAMLSPESGAQRDFSLTLSESREKVIEKREIVPMSVYEYAPKKRLGPQKGNEREEYQGGVGVIDQFFTAVTEGNRGKLAEVLDPERSENLRRKSDEEFRNDVLFYKNGFSQNAVYLTHRVRIFDSTAFLIAGMDANGDVVSKLPIFLRKTEEGWRVTRCSCGEITAALLHGYPYDNEEIVKTRVEPGVVTDGTIGLRRHR